MNAMRLPCSALTLAAALCLAPAADAMTMRKKAFPNQGFFGIEVRGTDMSFYGRADHVVSVSFQEYTTGAFIVSEVVVDMQNSNQQLRIYHTRTPGSADVADRANRASTANSQNRGLDPAAASKLPIPGPFGAIETQVNNLTQSTTAGLVVKNYPTTTHAKTVEMTVNASSVLMPLIFGAAGAVVGVSVVFWVVGSAVASGAPQAWRLRPKSETPAAP